MRALIVGVGDAFTCKHFGSSAVVEGPTGLVLIDCPDLIHRALLDASRSSGWNVAASDINDIIITHLHGDHCNGLESFAFARWVERAKTGTGVKPRVHCWKPVADRLWERLAPAMDMINLEGRTSTLDDYLELHLLDEAKPAHIAGLTFRCRRTLHPIPTIGLLISDGDSTFGWSGDTPFEQAHIDWLSAAGLIIHESNAPPAHTRLEDLEALPASLKRRMRLIHLADDADLSRSTLQALHEGDVLEFQACVTG